MSEEIEVSVIVPVYNEEKYITRCLSSLKKQTYPQERIEWLFVDGKSSDNTVELINEFAIPNSKILLNEKRLVTYAVNMGVENAVGT